MNCNLFKIYVHRPDEFPLVRDRGFALGPGQEMFVSVDAVGEIFPRRFYKEVLVPCTKSEVSRNFLGWPRLFIDHESAAFTTA